MCPFRLLAIWLARAQSFRNDLPTHMLIGMDPGAYLSLASDVLSMPHASEPCTQEALLQPVTRPYPPNPFRLYRLADEHRLNPHGPPGSLYAEPLWLVIPTPARPMVAYCDLAGVARANVFL